MNEKQVLELIRSLVTDGHAHCDATLEATIDRRLAVLPAAAQGEPTIDECLDAYDDGLKSQGEQRATHTDGIAAVRSLMLRARPAPSPEFIAAADAMRAQAWKYRSELAVERAVNAYDLARSSLPAAKQDN